MLRSRPGSSCFLNTGFYPFFGGPAGEKSHALYLQERYLGRRIDVIIPVGGFALEFALGHREELFPAAGFLLDRSARTREDSATC
jgi:hypothetical protein